MIHTWVSMPQRSTCLKPPPSPWLLLLLSFWFWLSRALSSSGVYIENFVLDIALEKASSFFSSGTVCPSLSGYCSVTNMGTLSTLALLTSLDVVSMTAGMPKITSRNLSCMSHTKSAAVLGESLPPTDTAAAVAVAVAVAVAAPEATCLVAILILGFVLLGVS